MLDYFAQVDATAENPTLYYTALAGALVIPDICAALAAPNGKTTKSRYKSWFDANFPPEYIGFLSADECYGFRCSFLHEGNSYPHQTDTRVLFLEPGSQLGTFHRNRLDNAILIDVRLFCLDMTTSARQWWHASQGKEPFETNARKTFRVHPNGISPYIVGLPVIG